MVITLFRRIAICQSATEVKLRGMVALGAASQRFNFVKALDAISFHLHTYI